MKRYNILKEDRLFICPNMHCSLAVRLVKALWSLVSLAVLQVEKSFSLC